MKAAFAVKGDVISNTLGGCSEFVLISGADSERVPCAGKIPVLLKKLQVDALICGGIGNCTMDLLESMGIEIIPGVVGTVEEVVKTFRSGALTRGVNYSCTDHGRSCGECPGCF